MTRSLSMKTNCSYVVMAVCRKSIFSHKEHPLCFGSGHVQLTGVNFMHVHKRQYGSERSSV